MSAFIDTNVLFSLAAPNDADHERCLRAVSRWSARLIVPVTVLPELSYLLADRLGHHVMRAFLRQVHRTNWDIEQLTTADLQRAIALLDQHTDSELDFADATIVAMAERLNVQTIFTMDIRDFAMIRPNHVEYFTLLP